MPGMNPQYLASAKKVCKKRKKLLTSVVKGGILAGRSGEAPQNTVPSEKFFRKPGKKFLTKADDCGNLIKLPPRDRGGGRVP